MTAGTDLLNPGFVDFEYIEKLKEKARQPSPLFGLRALYGLAATAVVRWTPSIRYISDNGGCPDLAESEIVSQFRSINKLFHAISGRPSFDFDVFNSPSMNVLAGAFDVAQLSQGNLSGPGDVYVINCAVRKKQRGKEGDNGGEKLYAGILPNGAFVVGTGPDVFAFFKDQVQSGDLRLYEVAVATNGTQFRSRDYFPVVASIIADYLRKPKVNKQLRSGLSADARDKILFGLNIVKSDRRLQPQHIEDLKNDGMVVARVDAHGNLKLAARHGKISSSLKDYGDDVVIYANGKAIEASLTKNSFDKDNQTVLSAGSSGRGELGAPGKATEPFAEIFKVGGSACNQLGLSEALLKQDGGVEVHVFPKSIFDRAKAQFEEGGKRTTDAALAKAFVDNGLASGINFSRLEAVVEAGRLSDALKDHPPEAATGAGARWLQRYNQRVCKIA